MERGTGWIEMGRKERIWGEMTRIEEHLEGNVETEFSGHFLKYMRVFLARTSGNGGYGA